MSRGAMMYAFAKDYIQDFHCVLPALAGWRVDIERDSADAWSVRVHRGLGRGIEYGRAQFTLLPSAALTAGEEAEQLADCIRKAVTEAHRAASFQSWVKSKGGVVVGVAGKWRKWGAA